MTRECSSWNMHGTNNAIENFKNISEIAYSYGFPCPTFLSQEVSRHFLQKRNSVEFDNMLRSLLYGLLVALTEPPVDKIVSCYSRYILYIMESDSKEIYFRIGTKKSAGRSKKENLPRL